MVEVARQAVPIGVTIGAIADDDYSDAIVRSKATNALEIVRRFQWDLGDLRRTRRSVRRLHGLPQARRGGDGGDHRLRVAGRSRGGGLRENEGIDLEAQRFATGEILADNGIKARATVEGKTAGDAIRELGVEVERARDDFTGPAALRSGSVDWMQELSRLEAVNNELESQRPDAELRLLRGRTGGATTIRRC